MKLSLINFKIIHILVKWNYLSSTKDKLIENILDNLFGLGINKDTCEELFNYAMYENHTNDSSRFISNIMLHGGLDEVKSFLLNEINRFDYQSERENSSFDSSRIQFEKAILNHNKALQLFNDIFN